MNKSTSASAFLNKATVIIPCFNVEDYIKECLDSVVQQEGSVHHTYVVDNNSTDSTWIKVREWQTANPSIAATEDCTGRPQQTTAPCENKVDSILRCWIFFCPGKSRSRLICFQLLMSFALQPNIWQLTVQNEPLSH